MLWPTKPIVWAAVLLAGHLFSPVAMARIPAKSSGLTSSYELLVRNQFGNHTNKPLTSLATNRAMIDLTQNLESASGLSLSISGRIRAEGAFATNDAVFTDEQAEKDSSQIEMRDAYLQYKSGGLMIRAGQQQVVWGEAFGFFFADIINPKDLREGSLFGLFEMADLRDPIPMVNAQWRGRDWTFQGLYGPSAAKHRLPRWGSPFSPVSVYDFSATGGEVQILEPDQAALVKGDYGGRVSGRWGGLDLALFSLNYMDRMPTFELVSFNPTLTTFVLRERQSRVQSHGFTWTYDFSGYLARFESVFTKGRRFNYLAGGSTLSELSADEVVGVLGLDLKPMNNWYIGLQVSNTSLLSVSQSLLGRTSSQSLAAIRVSRTVAKQHEIELMSHLAIEDGSSFHYGRWTFARSRYLEFLFGYEILLGARSSWFGRLQDGSRFMFGIKGAFSG